ncbi:MAG: imidazolonepropionase [Chitinivibrionales bacterium]|nr:imidazolonepropionase [Chitinivibrionales bacterium]
MNICDLLITNTSEVITCAGSTGSKRGKELLDVGRIADGAIAITDGNISAVDSRSVVEKQFRSASVIDAKKRSVVPGFVDSHTHVVYGGDRIAEFEKRIAGVPYLEILAAGGGIIQTMRQTRQASFDELVIQAKKRLDAMISLGTTTVEIKSGYGLTVDDELKMLQVIERLQGYRGIDCIPTFLGAHAVPPEYQHSPEAYVSLCIDTMMPAIAAWYEQSVFKKKKIPLFADVFCEQNAFSRQQSFRILNEGLKWGMRSKIHADEFTSLGAVAAALDCEAVSVDHCDVISPEDRKRLAASDGVGVLLPAVNFNFGSSQYAPARALINAGAAICLATDLNPGSAPCASMQFVMAVACRYQKLLPAEALNGCTINAACAIALADRVGSLAKGKQADLCILDSSDYRVLAYEFGGNAVSQVIKKGVIVS